MILFLISLLITIITHEFGHLIAAKLVKCKVEVFSIGFGKELFSFIYKGTKYRLALFPLGGYNKLKDETCISQDKYAFTNLRYRDKLIIVSAGCLINVIMGIICLYIGEKSNIYNLIYFGWISLTLGITNMLPIPALDGSYPILVWLEKLYGKQKGYAIMGRICKWGFNILMVVNILCIPFLIRMIMKGQL